ncbi:hypothetical protein [Nonomuraea typhae]|uniref:Secreted protein n=1 Tax=Nonomuraea typhae TaxID=2603600 RepID=A0ABW7Z887_9ACTN
MTTYRSLGRPARWLIAFAALWLCAAMWSPGSPASPAEPVPAASAVHLGEEAGTEEAGSRVPQRQPAKRTRAVAGPPPAAPGAGSPAPASVVRRAGEPGRAGPAGHTELRTRLSVWRI